MTARTCLRAGDLGRFRPKAVHDHVIHPGGDIDEAALRRQEIFFHQFVAHCVVEAGAHEFRRLARHLVPQFRPGVEVQQRLHRGIQ